VTCTLSAADLAPSPTKCRNLSETAEVPECKVFFFSSRRRHTRSDRDWSSDVCSSDLIALREFSGRVVAAARGDAAARGRRVRLQIGRASCRERVWHSGAAGQPKKKTHQTQRTWQSSLSFVIIISKL